MQLRRRIRKERARGKERKDGKLDQYSHTHEPKRAQAKTREVTYLPSQHVPKHNSNDDCSNEKHSSEGILPGLLAVRNLASSDIAKSSVLLTTRHQNRIKKLG